MTLGFTQPLTEMSPRDISWGKGGRCVWLTTLPSSRADCLKIWEHQPTGTLKASEGLQWDCFTFYCFISKLVFPLSHLTVLFKNHKRYLRLTGRR
jgi:hypothetical protein